MTSMTSSHMHDPDTGFDMPKMIHPALDHSSSNRLYVFESPVDYTGPGQYRDDHDMEFCSEQDDAREREHEDDEDEDEDEDMHARKVSRRLSSMDIKDGKLVSNKSVRAPKNGHHGGVEEGADMEEVNGPFASSSSRKPSSPPREETKTKKTRAKVASPKGKSRQTSVQAILDEALAEYVSIC